MGLSFCDELAAFHAAGIVVSLHRWPVKSMAGQPIFAGRIDERGLAGDRTHALFDTFRGKPRRLTLRQAPRLLAWRASYPDEVGGEFGPDRPPLPHLIHPDGRTQAWEDPDTPRVLADDLGRQVSLCRDERGQQDYGPSVLLTFEATRLAIEHELGRPLDLRRFRTNVHIESNAPAFAEEAWSGRSVSIGSAQLRILHPCERCVIPTRNPDDYNERWPELLRWLHHQRRDLFGVIARPVGIGTLAIGDAVRVCD